MTLSKLPGRKPKPCPMSCITFGLSLECDLWPIRQHIIPEMGKNRMSSPSIVGAMSTPAQTYPSRSRISPDKAGTGVRHVNRDAADGRYRIGHQHTTAGETRDDLF